MHSHSILLFAVTLFCALWITDAVNITATSAQVTAQNSKIYGKHRLTTYVVDWEVPKSIQWNKLDHIAYAFAEPNAKGELKSYTAGTLKSVVSQAHKNKVGVSISVGGWSGSKYFSTLLSSKSKMNTLTNNIVKMVDNFNLDGVNLDWEYPNDPNGVACNAKSPKDTANYLAFVQALRKALNKKYPKVHKLITIAVGTNPFNDEHQNPLKALNKGWASSVDSFYIMSYDISGSWMSKSGPNAPLKASPSRYDSSVVQSVAAWHKAGIPSNKIVVGIPFYGTALKTNSAVTLKSRMYVPLAKPSAIKGDKYDELSADPCPGAKKSYSGSFQWRSIVSAGITKNKNGWKSYWDTTSSTPYAFRAKDKHLLSFDNAKSLKEKINYVKQHGLGGAMVWSLEMDDASHTLLGALQGVRK